jgi:diguanylate cyclase (GGDEF)-like protein/PAS domain S-box-containing protein
MGIDRDGWLTIFNQAAREMTGYTQEEVLGRMNISHIYYRPETARVIKKKLYSEDYGGKGRLMDFETEMRTKSGTMIPIRLSAALIFKDGCEFGSVGFFHDMTTRKMLENRLRELSVTDSLTGLYNQRHFYMTLTRELGKAIRYQRPLSLICFDLDRFKQCNDTLGHLEGDNILRSVGEIMRNTLRSTDRAFRYGGDEFMIVLPETELQSAYITAERIRETFNTKWNYNSLGDLGQVCRVTLSLGLAQAGDEEVPEQFVRRADLAMYESKRSGGDKTVAADAKIGICT